MGDGGSLLLDKAQRMLVTSSGSFMCCNTCLFVCLSICLISNVMPKVCCPCLPKQMNFRKFFKQTGKSLSCGTGGHYGKRCGNPEKLQSNHAGFL